MTHQLPIEFTSPAIAVLTEAFRPPRGPVDTSRAAAESQPAGKVAQDCALILAALTRHGRLIRPELQERTGISVQSITARLNQLCKAGLIRMLTDAKPGPTGRRCHFYERVA